MITRRKSKIGELSKEQINVPVSDLNLYLFLHEIMVGVLLNKELCINADMPDKYIDRNFNTYIDWLDTTEIFFKDAGMNRQQINSLVSRITNNWNINNSLLDVLIYYALCCSIDIIREINKLKNIRVNLPAINYWAMSSFGSIFDLNHFSIDNFTSHFWEFIGIIQSTEPEFVMVIQQLLRIAPIPGLIKNK